MEKTSRAFEYKKHWLFQRRDTGKWYIACWISGRGRRHIQRTPTGTADFRAARDRLIEYVERGGERAEKIVLPASQPPPVVAPANPPILDILCDYVERLADRPSHRTALPALGLWTEFLDIKGIRFVRDLTLDVQEDFVRWRKALIISRGGKCSNNTLIRELGVLKAALRDGWMRGRLVTVPYIKSLPSPPPRDHFLTVEEMHRLLAACDQPHLRLFVMLALNTMQRPIAILNLQTRQVDLANNLINFLPPGAVQTNKRRPIVPITRMLRPVLEVAVKNSISGYVVEWEGKKITQVRTAFQKACKRAGLTNCTPYVLRHTMPTLLAAAGVEFRQIARFIGHEEAETTERYMKRRPEFLGQAANKIDELLAVPSSSFALKPLTVAPRDASRDANAEKIPPTSPDVEATARRQSGHAQQAAMVCETADFCGDQREDDPSGFLEGKREKMVLLSRIELPTPTLPNGRVVVHARRRR